MSNFTFIYQYFNRFCTIYICILQSITTFVRVLFNCYKIAARLKIFHKLETKKMKEMKSICTFGKIKYFKLCSKTDSK